MNLTRTGGGGGAEGWIRWDPEEVARAVVAVSGVVRLVAAPARSDRASSSPAVLPAPAATAAEVATYLPGRRVVGVRVRPDGIAVQVECRFGERLGSLAERVRAAVLAVAPGCPRVDVLIRDLVAAPTGPPR